MRKDITITAETRTTRGKNEARRLRVRGSVPAIVYGSGKDPVAIAVNPKEITKLLHSTSGQNTIFNLDIQGVENTPVMLVDWQEEPIKSRLLHADLKRIDLTKRLEVAVPVVIVGEPKGVKIQGGLLELIVRNVQIECLPDEIPENFTLDVSELMLNQAKRASDIELSGSMRLISPPEAVVAHIVALRAEAEATPPEGAVAPTTPEPEVIKKGKKEEEGAAETPKKGETPKKK